MDIDFTDMEDVDPENVGLKDVDRALQVITEAWRISSNNAYVQLREIVGEDLDEHDRVLLGYAINSYFFLKYIEGALLPDYRSPVSETRELIASRIEMLLDDRGIPNRVMGRSEAELTPLGNALVGERYLLRLAEGLEEARRDWDSLPW